MKPEPEQKRLLNDVALEGADFREAMLGQTLRVVRRRRHGRQAGRAVVLFLALGIASFLVYRHTGRHSSPTEAQTVSRPYRLVQTIPLPVAALVSTQPFTNAVIAFSSAVQIVQTTPASGNFRVLNDDELLASVARPAVLMRIDAHSERLIFVNSDGEKDLEPH